MIVATYPSYEEANARQIDLWASTFESEVIRESTGFEELYLGIMPRYHLFVHEEDFDGAMEVVRLVEDPEHTHIASCEKCNGSDVVEIGIAGGVDASDLEAIRTFLIPMVLRFFHLKFVGPKFHCRECNHHYRVNYRNKK